MGDSMRIEPEEGKGESSVVAPQDISLQNAPVTSQPLLIQSPNSTEREGLQKLQQERRMNPLRGGE